MRRPARRHSRRAWHAATIGRTGSLRRHARPCRHRSRQIRHLAARKRKHSSGSSPAISSSRKPSTCRKRLDPHHDDAAAACRFAGGPVPFAVAEPIVDRSLGMALAEPAGDGGHFGCSSRNRKACSSQPGIAVRSLHRRTARIARAADAIRRKRRRPALRARAAVNGICGVQFDRLDSVRARPRAQNLSDEPEFT